MKIRAIIAALMIPAGMSFAQATAYTFNVTEGLPIPDGNPVGFSQSIDLTGMAGTISDVTVNLAITGGFNGDLYAYLVGPNGGFAVLLNRTGVTTGNTFGYFDSGFNITLDDSGANNNIHFYNTFSLTFVGGQLTGTWASDGENVDPLGSLVGLSGSTATLLSFNGTDPNGMWTFFVADLSSGGTATLNSFSLTIMTVPEPPSWLLLFVGAMMWLAMGWRKKPARQATVRIKQ